MSKYTTELRFIVNSGYDVGLSKYPIFDEGYRAQLNQRIIQHYYFREIGQETAGLFKFMMEARMNEIMPYYNQLYESTLLKFDPMVTTNFTEETGQEGNVTEDSSSNVVNGGSSTTTTNTKEQNERDISGTLSKTGSDDTTTSEDGTLKGTTTSNTTAEQSATTDDTTTTDRTVNTVIDVNSTESKNTESEVKHLENRTPQGAMTDPFKNGYASSATKDNTDNTVSGNGTEKTSNDVMEDSTVTGKGSTSGSTETNGTETKNDTTTKDGTIDRKYQETGKNDTTDTYNGQSGSESVFENNATQDTTGKTERNTTNRLLRILTGKNDSRSYSELLIEFRQTFLNIDLMIINDLDDLFMGIW